MINFFDEINEKFKTSLKDSAYDFKVIYTGAGAYIEGHQGIIDFSESEISFKLKKGKITFFGENIFVKSLDVDTSFVAGKILKVERV